MGILILASKDVHRDSGCSFFISKLGDWWFYQQTHGCSRIDQAFNLIHQRLADACSEEFFEIEATESCPFNMPWHLDMKSPGCSGNLFTRFCVCLLSDWIMSGRTHTYLQDLPRMELLFQFISHMSHSRWFPQFICLCKLKWGFTQNIPKWFSSLLLIFLVVGLSALWNQRWEGVPRL